MVSNKQTDGSQGRRANKRFAQLTVIQEGGLDSKIYLIPFLDECCVSLHSSRGFHRLSYPLARPFSPEKQAKSLVDCREAQLKYATFPRERSLVLQRGRKLPRPSCFRHAHSLRCKARASGSFFISPVRMVHHGQWLCLLNVCVCPSLPSVV